MLGSTAVARRASGFKKRRTGGNEEIEENSFIFSGSFVCSGSPFFDPVRSTPPPSLRNMILRMNWLMKEEPTHYSFDDLVRDKKTSWTGVKNALAQKHLRGIQKGDRIFFYH